MRELSFLVPCTITGSIIYRDCPSMKKLAGVLLFAGLVILPVSLTIALSYTGVNHPVEKRVLKNYSFLDSSDNDIEVLFFGYAGCPTVCPLSLSKLAHVLESEHIRQKEINVGGMFVEVKAVHESATQDYDSIADYYSQNFSTHIRGFTPDLATYQDLAHEFILRLHEDKSSGRLSHTDHFFILNRTESGWIVERVLNNQVSKEQLLTILEETINQNNQLTI